MASTYSTNLRLELIGSGEQQGTWGNTTNVNLGTLLEQAIAGYEEVTFATDANITLTANQGAADQSRNAVLKFLSTPTLTATRNVVCPTIEKTYIIWNATTGTQSIQFKTAAGTGITIPNGAKVICYVNGTDVVQVFSTASYQASSTELTGLSALSTNGVLRRTGAGTYTTDTALTVANGGTGATTLTGLVKGNGTSAFTAASNSTDYVAPGTAPGARIVGATSTATLAPFTIPPGVAVTSGWSSGDLWNVGGTLSFYNGTATKTVAFTDSTITGNAANVTGTVAAANGGTGQTSYATGDLLYASASTTLSKLADVAVGSVLVSGGVGAAPSYSANPQVSTIELGAATDTTLSRSAAGVMAVEGVVVPTISSTNTLTNKRITARVSSTTSITSPLAWNSDNFDQYAATAQAAALTISADAGTPTDGQKMLFRFKDNAAAKVITFTGGTAKGFRPVGVSLTTSGSNFTYTTTASKTVYFGCVYNAADQRWDVVALSSEA